MTTKTDIANLRTEIENLKAELEAAKELIQLAKSFKEDLGVDLSAISSVMSYIGKPVLVTTDKDRRGVFSGILASDPRGDSVTLRRCRMAAYWDAATRGVVGLAVTGPTNGCRITKAMPELTLDGVTAVGLLSEEAWKAWESEPWSDA